MRNKVIIFVLFALLMSVLPAGAQGPVELVWFIGLGTGGAPEQLEVQTAVVDAWNAANPDIQVTLSISETTSRVTLSVR
jgi:ABC-type glycerol-3-phosphate transport system substrate-binding protein